VWTLEYPQDSASAQRVTLRSGRATFNSFTSNDLVSSLTLLAALCFACHPLQDYFLYFTRVSLFLAGSPYYIMPLYIAQLFELKNAIAHISSCEMGPTLNY
jgi:hypothetical protein